MFADDRGRSSEDSSMSDNKDDGSGEWLGYVIIYCLIMIIALCWSVWFVYR